MMTLPSFILAHLPATTSFHSTRYDTSSLWIQLTAFMALVVLGTYLFARMKQSSNILKISKKQIRHLTLLETRPLGNRQYLLVATYQNQKFLLSVQPNGIRYLCPLDGERKGQAES